MISPSNLPTFALTFAIAFSMVCSLAVQQGPKAAEHKAEVGALKDTIGRVTALRAMIGNNPSPNRILALLCHSVKDMVLVDCENVSSIENMLKNQGAGSIVGGAAKQRSKRSLFENWPFEFEPIKTTSWNSPSWKFDNPLPPSSGGSGPDPFNSGSFGSKSNVFVCPTQGMQDLDYKLSGNSTGYPANDISSELALVPDLLSCLIPTVIFENDPPTLFEEAYLISSDASCPFSQLRLWNYNSRKANSQCWVIQGFQENVIFRRCLTKTPQQCEQKKGDYFVFSQPTKNINTCLVEYERASVWAYCPSLTQGSRIIRDRVIYPKACTPFSVPCQAARDKSHSACTEAEGMNRCAGL